jgi:hypothetical protein
VHVFDRHALPGLLFALAALARSPSSEACSVCATADVTLAPAEGEAAYVGRFQATLDGREGWVSAGGVTVTDERAELGLHYAPTALYLLSIGVPVLVREIAGPGDPEVMRTAPGDVELRIDRVRTTSLRGGSHQRFGVFFELKLPTAPLERDESGNPLGSVLQPGCGSLVPAAGVTYSLGRGEWSMSSSLSVWMPFAVRSGYHAGDSIRLAARAQWQPIHSLAVRVGGNVNADTAGELAARASDPNSGGLVGYAAAEIVTTPATDFVLEVGALYPALTFLAGDHREGPIAMATARYDF